MMRKVLPRVLLGVGALPFVGVALVHCTKPAADAVTTTSVDAAAPVQSSAAAVSVASADVVASATVDAASVVSASSSAASSAAPGKTATRAECLALAKAHDDFAASHRACTSDADCKAVNASCGLVGVCGAPLNATHEKALMAKDDAFTSAGCMAVLAVPCPTCPMWGKPKCVGGKCELVK